MNDISEDKEDVNKKHMQLNLRISTTNDGSSTFLGSNHVARILIQNYSSFSDSTMSPSVEESLKMSLSNLRLEGFVQPLFRIEKVSTDFNKI
jgi:hypothetical protein